MFETVYFAIGISAVIRSLAGFLVPQPNSGLQILCQNEQNAQKQQQIFAYLTFFSISFTENHKNYVKMAVATDWSDADGLADKMAGFEK